MFTTSLTRINCAPTDNRQRRSQKRGALSGLKLVRSSKKKGNARAVGRRKRVDFELTSVREEEFVGGMEESDSRLTSVRVGGRAGDSDGPEWKEARSPLMGVSSGPMPSITPTTNSIDNIIRDMNKCSRNVYVATCAANIAAAAAGCVLAWTSPTLSKTNLSEDEKSWVASLVPLGAAIGPFISIYVVDVIGRKFTILADMILFVISWAIIASTSEPAYWYGARVLAGIAVGCIFTILPMYVAEIAPVDMRGRLGSLMQLFLCVGFLIQYIIGPYVSIFELIVINGGVAILCVAIFLWMPDSPHHLVNKGDHHAAFASLKWIRGTDDNEAHHSEIAQIKMASAEAAQNQGTFKELFTTKANLKALYYACVLAFFQQTSGINVVLFYSQDIFKATKSSIDASLCAIIIGSVMTVTSAAVGPVSKVIGIKNSLHISAIGEMLALVSMGAFFYLKDETTYDPVQSLSWLPVTSLIVFIVAYTIGFGPFVWVIMAEIFPAHLKVKASAITAGFCWILAFLLTKYFELFSAKFGLFAAYWLFAGFCLLALFFTLFQLPTTEGKTFSEIQQMLSGEKPPNQNGAPGENHIA